LTTQYVDGLGRNLQSVSRKLSANQTDIVTPVYFDEYGRESHNFLPYESGSTDGGFRADPFAEQYNFYTGTYTQNQPSFGGEQFLYGKTKLESSPLGRPEKVFAAGNNWAGSEGAGDEHAIKTQYLLNNASDQIRIWNIGNSQLTYYNEDLYTNIPFSSNVYDAGNLFKTVIVDENGHATVEYKDKEGHVVLKKFRQEPLVLIIVAMVKAGCVLFTYTMILVYCALSSLLKHGPPYK